MGQEWSNCQPCCASRRSRNASSRSREGTATHFAGNCSRKLDATTAHSPIGLQPERYGIALQPLPSATFARNDLEFVDPVGTDHEALGNGLRKALYNYMHGAGLDADVRIWFEPARAEGRRRGGRQRRRRSAHVAVPATTVPPDLIERFLG